MKVRVTQLESFRRFIADEPYSSEESLIESWSGIFKGNEYTRIGTAFHKIVEHGLCCDVWNIDGFDVKVNHQQIQAALDYKEEIKGCFHEVRLSKKYLINSDEITVSGACDVLHGYVIRDIKTKYSDVRSIDDYIRSCQWKFYLDIFEVPHFIFDVFQFVGYDKDKNGYDVSRLEIKRHDPIECLWYNKMNDDLHHLLYQFVEYVRFKHLEHLFN